MAQKQDTRSAIRMRFELARDDNPPLFEELIKFAKGTKRLNRLRTLAHEGLVAQRRWTLAPGAHLPALGTSTQPEQQAEDAVGAAAVELFGPAADA